MFRSCWNCFSYSNLCFSNATDLKKTFLFDSLQLHTIQYTLQNTTKHFGRERTEKYDEKEIAKNKKKRNKRKSEITKKKHRCFFIKVLPLHLGKHL